MTIRTTPPPVAAAADWRFPRVTESRLDSGLRVLVYDCPGQFVVSASLLFDVPLSAEPLRIEGVAGLTGRCLTRGAAGWTAEEFADAVALCGADLDASAFADGFAVRLAAPATRFSPALALMADAVMRPAFLRDEFDQEKRLRLQEIEQARAYPHHVAVEELNAALYGSARSGRPVGGAADTVEQVSLDDVVEYAAAHLHPGNATLIVAGDFAGLDPRDMIATSFGGWSDAGSERVTTLPDVVCEEPQLLLVDWPEAPQSTVRIGGAGIPRGDARWPSMFVANFAVGGNFSSRINTVLREQNGVTYGANSSLDTSRGSGVVTVSTAVRSDATAASVADIASILAAAAGTLTDEEVAMGVRAATDSAALGYERAEAVVTRVEMLLSQGLPLDYVDTNLAGLRAVTTSSANNAYVDVVDPAALTVIVVGDAALLRDSLAALGYADLREVTRTA
ncbi:MAG: insulinase family protein [Propionibacteriales bacterium]|nr:insulinase family protein [Propionibacteriales bacterium]